MKNLLDLLRLRTTKDSVEREVEEEFRFHIDMQTGNYENRGIAPEQSRAMAEARFGDVQRIKTECVRISRGSTVLTWVLNFVFLMSLILGLLLRLLVPEMHVNRVGNVMMMIGGLGILLVYAKRAGAMMLSSTSKSVRLGLDNSTPVSFDEQGRTPFDRVRADD